jgi:hypothetical protein
MANVKIEGLENSGLVQRAARVLAVRGKYFLEIGGIHKALQVDLIADAELERATGREVTAVLAGRNIVAIAVGPKRPWWVCFIPVPELFRRVEPELQREILGHYVAEGVISRLVAGKLEHAI